MENKNYKNTDEINFQNGNDNKQMIEIEIIINGVTYRVKNYFSKETEVKTILKYIEEDFSSRE
ncbi:MAG: hypothetical protein LBU94_03205 [Clostridiales bacterium]|jgi:hypothetical protein|nr:hypothetical protein [Clostridiales bacterium]